MEHRKTKIAAAIGALSLAAALSGCGQQAENQASETDEKDSVVVVMTAESEPEEGFDPGLRLGSRRARSRASDSEHSHCNEPGSDHRV